MEKKMMMIIAVAVVAVVAIAAVAVVLMNNSDNGGPGDHGDATFDHTGKIIRNGTLAGDLNIIQTDLPRGWDMEMDGTDSQLSGRYFEYSDGTTLMVSVEIKNSSKDAVKALDDQKAIYEERGRTPEDYSGKCEKCIRITGDTTLYAFQDLNALVIIESSNAEIVGQMMALIEKRIHDSAVDISSEFSHVDKVIKSGVTAQDLNIKMSDMGAGWTDLSGGGDDKFYDCIFENPSALIGVQVLLKICDSVDEAIGDLTYERSALLDDDITTSFYSKCERCIFFNEESSRVYIIQDLNVFVKVIIYGDDDFRDKILSLLEERIHANSATIG